DVLGRAVDEVPVVHAGHAVEVQAVDSAALLLVPAIVRLHEEQQREQPRLVIGRDEQRAANGELDRPVLPRERAQGRHANPAEPVPLAVLARAGRTGRETLRSQGRQAGEARSRCPRRSVRRQACSRLIPHTTLFFVTRPDPLPPPSRAAPRAAAKNALNGLVRFGVSEPRDDFASPERTTRSRLEMTTRTPIVSRIYVTSRPVWSLSLFYPRHL